ncbi:unnamed protein product, partial [marine sediment metagenome]
AMIDFAKLPLDERAALIQEVANRRGLTRLMVEKDFWVCFTLRLLFSTPELVDKFVFKGGTSLSKVFGIIKRFSEDIDLSVDPEWLGFGGDNRPDAGGSRSQFEKRCKKLEQACITAVGEQIQTILEQTIREGLGVADSGGSYLSFQVDSQTRSPVIIFRYPTEEPESSGYIPPQVRLEFGSLTDQQPIGKHTVTPWAAEEFPDLFKEPSCQVVALEAERTFWEKATILHSEHHRPREKPMRNRLSRDCYDLCMMAEHESGQHALADLDMLARVTKHKQVYFRSTWSSYETAKPGTFRLVPPDHRIADMKTDYQEMQ